MNANKLGTARGIFYDQPSENADSWKSKREKEKHSNGITRGDLAIRSRDWTLLVSSVVRASASARINLSVSFFAKLLVSVASGGASRRIAC